MSDVEEPHVKKSPIIKRPYRILGVCMKRMLPTDSNRRGMLQLLDALLKGAPTMFDIFALDAEYLTEKQSGYLWLIGDIVQALREAIREFMERTIHLALAVLSKDQLSELHTVARSWQDPSFAALKKAQDS